MPSELRFVRGSLTQPPLPPSGDYNQRIVSLRAATPWGCSMEGCQLPADFLVGESRPGMNNTDWYPVCAHDLSWCVRVLTARWHAENPDFTYEPLLDVRLNK